MDPFLHLNLINEQEEIVATKQVCDNCEKECKSFVPKSELRMECSYNGAKVSVKINEQTELCPECPGKVFSKALLEVRKPYVKHRNPKDNIGRTDTGLADT